LQLRSWRRQARDCARELGLAQPIPIRATSGLRLETPVLAGICHPTILVDAALARRLARRSGAVRHVLLHELAHCQRRDNLRRLLWSALEAVHWFLRPLFWLCRPALDRDIEQAADDFALARLERQDWREYARDLLDVHEHNHPRLCNQASPFGGSGVQARIRRIAGLAGASGLDGGSRAAAALLLAAVALAWLAVEGALFHESRAIVVQEPFLLGPTARSTVQVVQDMLLPPGGYASVPDPRCGSYSGDGRAPLSMLDRQDVAVCADVCVEPPPGVWTLRSARLLQRTDASIDWASVRALAPGSGVGWLQHDRLEVGGTGRVCSSVRHWHSELGRQVRLEAEYGPAGAAASSAVQKPSPR
jgi:hypothetical protein